MNWLSTWRLAYYLFTPLIPGNEVPLGELTPASIIASGLITTSPLRSVQQVNTDKLERESSLTGILRSIVACAEATARIDRAGLSRAHKHLYLLINGQRTALELVPLVGRKVEEVRNMLHDLEWLGIIQLGNPPSSTEPW